MGPLKSFIFCALMVCNLELFSGVARAESHALIVVGIAGEEAQGSAWKQEAKDWETLLISRKIRPRVIASPEGGKVVAGETTRDLVKAHLDSWAKNLTAQDDAVLVMIGYTVTRQGHSQFQVRGPRLTGVDMVESLKNLKARALTVFVTGPGGVGLGTALAGKNRAIISATSDETEINLTRFGPYWIQMLAAAPDEPLIKLLNQCARKVNGYYEDHHFARTENARLWLNHDLVVEAPFDSLLTMPELQKWTLGDPTLATIDLKKGDGETKEPIQSPPSPGSTPETL